jgi:hypothetical protein
MCIGSLKTLSKKSKNFHPLESTYYRSHDAEQHHHKCRSLLSHAHSRYFWRLEQVALYCKFRTYARCAP